ncbi:MAG: basic amino acid ABC transporter substrate-binding protein [Clostridia bacterium]|nr:basic amino acid ABC transporter substrate-binding protein [Clostridia bacterium]
MKTMKKLLALTLAVLFVLTAFAGCGGKSSGNKLIMATNASFPPYEYKEGDAIVGIDAEIAAEIAKKLGMELEIKDTEFDSIIGGVQSGKFSMGMAGMTVTEDRLQSVNFSDTYAKGVQVIIVKEDSTIAGPDDLGDVMIGVQQSTTGHIYASGDYGEDHVTPYKTGNDAVQALVAGKVAAVIIDNEPAKSYVESNPGLKILDTAYAEEDYAICVAKENTDLLEKINAALAELKADGTVDSIVSKYIPA